MESRVAKTLQSSGLAQVGHFSAIKGFVEAAPNDAAIALQLSKHAMAYFLWRVVRSMKTLGRRIVCPRSAALNAQKVVERPFLPNDDGGGGSESRNHDFVFARFARGSLPAALCSPCSLCSHTVCRLASLALLALQVPQKSILLLVVGGRCCKSRPYDNCLLFWRWRWRSESRNLKTFSSLANPRLLRRARREEVARLMRPHGMQARLARQVDLGSPQVYNQIWPQTSERPLPIKLARDWWQGCQDHSHFLRVLDEFGRADFRPIDPQRVSSVG